jgi:hypothetical protein
MMNSVAINGFGIRPRVVLAPRRTESSALPPNNWMHVSKCHFPCKEKSK